MSEPVFDKIIVGGGIAGLAAAYQILRAAKDAGKEIKLKVICDKVSWPSEAGTNLVLGTDGFETGKLPLHANEINQLTREGLELLKEAIAREKIDCRLDMYYQIRVPKSYWKIPVPNRLLRRFVDGVLQRFGYKPEEFKIVGKEGERLNFKGFDKVIETDVIGQVNGPELLQGLKAAIIRMGGTVEEGVRYTDHTEKDGITEIQTESGKVYKTSTPPLLALGPHMPDKIKDALPVPIKPVYTATAHIQLDPEDAKTVFHRPVAFYDPSNNYLWGSLDPTGVLTIGQGASYDVNDRGRLEEQVRKTFGALLPHLEKKYADKIKIGFAAAAYMDNGLPVVGRLDGFDVITGNGGRGFVQAFAQAKAYADYFVGEKPRTLELFESLQVLKAPFLRPVHYLKSVVTAVQTTWGETAMRVSDYVAGQSRQLLYTPDAEARKRAVWTLRHMQAERARTAEHGKN